MTWHVTQWLHSNLINRNLTCVKEITCHDNKSSAISCSWSMTTTTVNVGNYYYIISKDHGQWSWGKNFADIWSKAVYGISWAQLWQPGPAYLVLRLLMSKVGTEPPAAALVLHSWCHLADIYFCINRESKQSIWWWVGRTPWVHLGTPHIQTDTDHNWC